MSPVIECLRNIGIIAHIDAGKTTTTERILFYAGASHRMGNVDEGTTITDFDPEEQQRGITIYSAAISCHWKNFQINLIDTPGHVDFTAEVERSLRVLDGGVVIFSAREGVEAQSETVWRQANKYNVPRICFINKMDRIGADFFRTLLQIRDRLGATPLAMQIPIGSGSGSQPFAGIIDLVDRVALYFESTSQGTTIDRREIPAEMLDQVDEYRGQLLEQVALLDDDALALYMEHDDIPADDIRRLVRQGTLQGKFQPVFCGSSLDYVGVQPLLDAVCDYLPSPLERPPVEGINPTPRKNVPAAESRPPSSSAPFCGLVFKILSDSHGDLCFIRVYSGTLKSRSRALNPRLGKKELISQLWHIQADRREKIEMDQVEAGDIVGVIGPKDVVTGDTLCDAQHPIALESITFPEPVISMAVEPESSADRKKLGDALQTLSRQDPTFTAKINEETGQTLIWGMGELHLDVIRHRLERDFKLNVRVHKPRVSYRETIRSAQEGSGEFSRTTAGATQTARLKVRVEPFVGEEAITLVNRLKPGTVTEQLVKIIEQAILDEARGGGILGYPLMHVKISILDAEYNDLDNAEAAFQTTCVHAVREGLTNAGVVLLEPVMKLEVTTPDNFFGNIQQDLGSRRAMILGTEQRGDLQVITAEVPLSQMFGYSTQVRSLSQGRASYSMEPLKYEAAPAEVLESMLT